MKALRVNMVFFDGDVFISRAMVLVHQYEETCILESKRGDTFHVTRQFEEPACRMYIESYSATRELVGHSAMRMGVHNSDDWEAIDLVEPYQLCFWCDIVDCDNPDWATQEPLTD